MTDLYIQVGTEGGRVGRIPVPLEVLETETYRRVESTGRFGGVAKLSVGAGDYQITAHLPSGRSVQTNTRIALGDRRREITLPAAEPTFDAELGQTHLTESEIYALRRWDRDAISLHDKMGHQIELRFWIARGRSRFERTETPHPINDKKHQRHWMAEMYCCLNAETKHSPKPLWMSVVVGKTGKKEMTQIIALPPAREVSIAIGKGHHSTDSHPRVVATGDLMGAEALMAYLHHGSTFAARLFGPHFVDEQMRKSGFSAKKADGYHSWKNSASAAAAVGYFSLDSSNHPAHFELWLEMFAASTAWFPDSNIIYASHLMREKKVNLHKVRDLLLEAYERGIPIYTSGLRQLTKNLAFLNERFEQKDDTIRQVSQEVDKWSLFADPSVMTTTIRPIKRGLKSSLLNFDPLK